MSGEREPWQVEQAQKAIRLYLFFQNCVMSAAPGAASMAAPDAWAVATVDFTRVMRVKHLSLRTERAYLGWLLRFREYVGGKATSSLTGQDVERFLSHLAVDGQVPASTQNQAFSALLYFFRCCLEMELGGLGETVRARTTRRVPIVLEREQVLPIIALMPAPFSLMVRII